MSIPKRHGHFPGTYFVTSRTWESRRLFVNEPLSQIFVDSLLKYRDQREYTLHAFVLMPDHFHALLTPSATATLERVMQLIKGGSSHDLGEQRQMRFPIWQRGFTDHRIRDTSDYAVHLRYIQLNPVRKHLVSSAIEYHWSSFSGKFSLDGAPQGLKPEEKTLAARHG
jgi:putative transposase